MPGFLEYRLDIGKVSELPLTTLSIPAEHGRGRCLRGVRIVAHSTVLTLARSQYSTCEVLVLTLFLCTHQVSELPRSARERITKPPMRKFELRAHIYQVRALQPAASLQPACNQPATSLQPTCSPQSMLRWLRLPSPLYMPY